MALSANILENKIKPHLKTAFETITLVGVSRPNFNKVQDGRVVEDKDAFEEAQRKAIAIAKTISDALAKDLAKEIVNHTKTASISCTIMPGAIPTSAGGAGPLTPTNISGTLK